MPGALLDHGVREESDITTLFLQVYKSTCIYQYNNVLIAISKELTGYTLMERQISRYLSAIADLPVISDSVYTMLNGHPDVSW